MRESEWVGCRDLIRLKCWLLEIVFYSFGEFYEECAVANMKALKSYI